MTNFAATPTPSPETPAGIDLRTILRLLRYWAWLLLLGALVGAGLGYAASIQSLPIYRTEVLLLIEETRPLYNTDIALPERTSTYLELINQGLMLEKVAQALQVDPQQLAATITAMRVEAIRNTQLFRVYVEGYHPDYLVAAANILPQVLSDEITNVRTERFAESRRNLTTQIDAIKAQIEVTQSNVDRLGTPRSTQQENQLRDLQTVLAQQQNSYANLVQSFENLRLVELQAMDNIAAVRSAKAPQAPISGNTIPNILLGSIVGIALMVTVITLIEYLDDRVRSPHLIQDTLGAIVLGAIDVIRTQSSNSTLSEKLIAAVAPRHPVAEAYRSIRTNLRFSTIDSRLRTLVVTSSSAGEGKSVTAANLAIVMAQLGLSVVLVDADLRKPTQHKLFGLKRQPGLSDALLADDAPPQHYLQEVDVPNLRLLPSGMMPPNPAELLSSQRMRHLLDALHAAVDVVILDTPPLLVVTDAAVLASYVRDVVLIVNAKRTQRSTLMRAIEALHKIDAHLCGVIVNELSRSTRSYAYYGDYYANSYNGYYGEAE
ncbi:MAG: polysaccharide biosynthesis tyrosine autokinase [Caldilinea sp. CFX5]|nr:polysaccharide biosynthesis tyrosine autokinase [Caldilinea sp. CFX5]